MLVGQHPDRLGALSSPGATATGPVADVAPYLERAALVLAPLWTGGGMRVKVLHALAAGKAVVATPRAVAGLGLRAGEEVAVADTPRPSPRRSPACCATRRPRGDGRRRAPLGARPPGRTPATRAATSRSGTPRSPAAGPAPPRRTGRQAPLKRILITSSYYWPEGAGTAPYVTGMAEHLSERGYDVAVSTTFPHYPAWTRLPLIPLGRSEEQAGVHIRRRWLYVPDHQSALQRAAYEGSMFAMGATALPVPAARRRARLHPERRRGLARRARRPRLPAAVRPHRPRPRGPRRAAERDGRAAGLAHGLPRRARRGPGGDRPRESSPRASAATSRRSGGIPPERIHRRADVDAAGRSRRWTAARPGARWAGGTTSSSACTPATWAASRGSTTCSTRRQLLAGTNVRVVLARRRQRPRAARRRGRRRSGSTT